METRQGLCPIFLAKFSDLPLTIWDSSSLTFPNFSQNWIKGFTHFLSLNTRSFKEIHGENLQNFKEILLMMYDYHKAAFTFEVSFSIPT